MGPFCPKHRQDTQDIILVNFNKPEISRQFMSFDQENDLFKTTVSQKDLIINDCGI